MKKLSAMILVFCLLLAGCGGDNTYEFDIQTGEKVELTLDSDAGMEISAGSQSFTLTKDGVETKCAFVEQDMIDDYFEWIPSASAGNYIESGKNDYGTYMFYSMDFGDGIEYGYVCTFNGTYIGVYIYNEVSEASVREAVASLSYSYEATTETNPWQ